MKQRTWLRTLLLAGILSGLFVLSAGAISVTVDGQAVTFTDATPYINSDNRTMIPLRAVADALQCQTEWDNDRGSATVSKAMEDVILSLTFYPKDEPFADEMSAAVELENSSMNFGLQVMDTAAEIRADRTHLPIRYVAEYFGYQVGWDQASQTVTIQSGGQVGTGVNGFSPSDSYKSTLTVELLASCCWSSNGYRLSDTRVLTFDDRGWVTATYPAGGEALRGNYSLEGNAVRFSLWDGSGTEEFLDYDPSTNLLLNRNKKVLAQQDYVDEGGNYHAPEMVTEILTPYNRDPWENSSAVDLSTPPTGLSKSTIKATLRPILKAQSSTKSPGRYLSLDRQDVVQSGFPIDYYRVLDISSVEQFRATLTPYLSARYLEEHFPGGWFEWKNGKFYVMDTTAGWNSWDASSVTYKGIVDKDTYAIQADSYNSADAYVGTFTIHLRNTGSGLLLYSLQDMPYEDKGYGSNYRPANYDPV